MIGSFSQAHNDYLDPDSFLPDQPDMDHMRDISDPVEKLIRNLVEDLNPGRFYRAVYKNGVGVMIGFKINGEWYRGSELPFIPCSWVNDIDDADISKGKIFCINAVSISSIVEGSEAEVPEIILEGKEAEEFWDVLEGVEQEVCRLWDEANNEENEDGLEM